MSNTRAFLTITRCEFLVGGVFFLFVVSALASGNWGQLRANIFIIICGIVVWCFSHMIGSQINCLADRDLDKEHKAKLFQSVNYLGQRKIWTFICIESIVAFLCTIYMAVLTGKPMLTVFWVLGWIIAVGYSLEPIRFKRRGLLNPFSLVLVLYVLPISFGCLALKNEMDVLVVKLFVSLGFQMFSLILMNELEDIPEDRHHNIETPCVRYGMWPIVPIALALFLFGAIATFICFYQLVDSKNTRYIIILLGVLGHIVIIRDLLIASIISWKSRSIDCPQSNKYQEVRRLGKRNAMHFGILGFIISFGCFLTL